MTEDSLHSFIWEGEITERDGGFHWELSLPDVAAAQRVLPLSLPEGDSYHSAWERSKHPVDWQGMQDRSAQALRSGSPFYHQEYRCFNQFGQEQWLSEEVTLEQTAPGRWRARGICTDITRQKSTESVLRESENRFEEAMYHAPIGMALVSLDGYFMHVNPALCEIVGYTEEEFHFLTFQEITHPEDLGADLSQIARLMEGSLKSYRIEKRYLHKEGHPIWVQLSGTLVRDERERPLYFISQVQDITRQKSYEGELERLNAELYRSSRRDHLTGLRNRLSLQEDLEVLRHHQERYGHSFCIAMCDVDEFKAYNDHYGYVAGDRVLQRVAETIRGECRTGDTAYRYGGEEFLLILPEQSVETAAVAMERIRAEVEALALPHEGKRPVGMVTISAGVAGMSAGESKDRDRLLREADEALYRAKDLGRNRVASFSKG